MNAEERKLALASFKQHPVWEFLSEQLMVEHKDALEMLCVLDPATDATAIARKQGRLEAYSDVFTILNAFDQEEETL